MVLWRISPFHDLNGEGGKLFSARWHTAGRPVVYLAGSAAGALLEMCVHTDAEDIPTSFTLLKVSGPDLQPSQVDDRAVGHGVVGIRSPPTSDWQYLAIQSGDSGLPGTVGTGS